MSPHPNRTSSIYKGKDGYWHGRVTIGLRDNGSRDRRHVMSKTKTVVVQKVRDLEKLRDEGRLPKVGQVWTVQDWLEHWLETIARPSLRETSYTAYRIAVQKHLVPALGWQRLDRLEPEHLERLYRGMIDGGSKPATAHQVHRTIRVALGEAARRGHMSRNPAALAKPPRVQKDPVDPYSVDEIRRILAATTGRPNAARWAIALSLGLRQGEALALRWRDIDLESGSLRVRWTRLRPIYAHGCSEPCGRHAGACPGRRQANGVIGETKSQAGKRVIGLPDQISRMLEDHQTAQRQARASAAELWEEGDWVFSNAVGRPLNPNSDYHEWKALLRRAGVREARLHDARHTAATVLLLLGVPERIVMQIMGWSSTAMAANYQHVTDSMRRDVARRVDGLIWETDES